MSHVWKDTGCLYVVFTEGLCFPLLCMLLTILFGFRHKASEIVYDPKQLGSMIYPSVGRCNKVANMQLPATLFCKVLCLVLEQELCQSRL